MKKPHIKLMPGIGWAVQIKDGRGVMRYFLGTSPRGAWATYQEHLRELDRLGLRWEVFP